MLFPKYRCSHIIATPLYFFEHLVEKYGSKILPLTLDVTNNEQVLSAVKTGHEHFGRIDVVVNNAGYADTVAVEDISLESFHAQFGVNYFGAGHIINISSVGGRMGTPGLAAYQSAKWAVGGFSTCLSQEVTPFGIKVTVIEPGGMNTDWAGSSMSIPPVKMIRKFAGQAPSSLEKIAEIAVKLSGLDEVPLRLLVGPDAVHFGGLAGQALKALDEKWKELSLSAAEQEFTGLPGDVKV
ncbi:NAD(P)-binding protein [Acephala macrosclerotiorum]|nr:NAD(P)-binding protein [Acephala macrosclerotiorum]